MSAQPVECYPSCPCGRCQVVRREVHDTRWSSLSIHERVQESLNAKIEGDGRMPERGMFSCADIQALLDIVRNQT